jgi:hypothetical protein
MIFDRVNFELHVQPICPAENNREIHTENGGLVHTQMYRAETGKFFWGKTTTKYI